MSPPRLTLKVLIGIIADIIIYSSAINNEVSNRNGSDSMHIDRMEGVGPRHFLHDSPQKTVNLAFHYLTLTVFIPLTILVNVLVLLTVGLIKYLHTPHDVTIAISSLMDLLVGMVYLPVDAYEQYDEHAYIGQTALSCELVYISLLPFSLSLTSYVLMSADRWVGVIYPFWYQANVTCWEIAVGSAIVIGTETVVEIILMLNIMEYDATVPLVIRCDPHEALPDWYVDGVQTTVITTKLFVSFILCLHVNIVARKHREKIKTQSRPVCLDKKGVQFVELRSLKPIVCSLLFIILWLPKIVFDDIHLSESEKHSLRLVDFILESFLVINSFVNPLLIISMKPLYRESFKTILSTPPWNFGNLREILRVMANQKQQKQHLINETCKAVVIINDSSSPEAALGKEGGVLKGHSGTSKNNTNSGNHDDEVVLNPDKINSKSCQNDVAAETLPGSSSRQLGQKPSVSLQIPASDTKMSN